VTGRRLSRADPGDSDTRRRVIDAAITCILEQGFYRASSNAIAERAGLSWGVIQYYFGSREALMLAVLEEGTRRLVDDLSTAELRAETLTGRIEEYLAILEHYYADPEYLAFIQVLMNLSHDPRTSAETRATIAKISETVDLHLKRLTNRLFTGTGVRHRDLRGLVFHALRGLALSEVMLGTVPFATPGAPVDFGVQRRLLADALTLLIEQKTGGRPS
jgi:TetR/AcrR family transcriptional regulator, regulator of cefoperazone and chloramphenicol sensitivity